MVDVDQLREFMRRQAEADRDRHSLQVSGKTLEEALSQASIELGTPISRLEYEVVQEGSKGALGVRHRDWSLVVYEAAKKKVDEEHVPSVNLDLPVKPSVASGPVDTDGEAYVRLAPEGALLKVVAPVGRGKGVTDRQALEKLGARGVADYNPKLVSEVVRDASSEWVKVGDFRYNPGSDSALSVEAADQEMKAYAMISRPGPGGADLAADSIIELLKMQGIVFGLKEDVIRELENAPRYGQRILVAEGTYAANGADAKIVYSFETDRSNIKLKEKNGRVDFRELNLVQNVVEGQILARKVPPQEGTSGTTVTGQHLSAKTGRDVRINAGKNVTLSEDGMTLTSDINGQVILSGDKVNVEPLYVVRGNVNLKTGGNVIFLGTVVVQGSVEDGFKVKASGNIEVLGNVGKCELDAEGDIIVHQGINGKNGGLVRSGKGVWSKFIENAFVEAGESVVASDGIINSNVDANTNIACHGKRATIVGGRLRAAELVAAKTFGSINGSETIVEVGYDPKSKARLAENEEAIQAIDKEVEEVDLNVHTLENLKKAKQKLPEEKENYLKELTDRRNELVAARKIHQEEIESVRAHLASLKTRGKISASLRVYPGVKIFIKDASLEIRNEFRSVTFIAESNLVKMTRYEEPNENFERRR